MGRLQEPITNTESDGISTKIIDPDDGMFLYENEMYLIDVIKKRNIYLIMPNSMSIYQFICRVKGCQWHNWRKKPGTRNISRVGRYKSFISNCS